MRWTATSWLVAAGVLAFIAVAPQTGAHASNQRNIIAETLAAPAIEHEPESLTRYGAFKDGNFIIPAIDVATVDPKFLRQPVAVPAGIPNEPGMIVVDPQNRFLYLILENGVALRYGVGVGREGFGWSGTARIHHAGAWPKWFPPSDMIKRDPTLAKYAAGKPGGLDNPLGARALYLFQGQRDTLYRIHGTNEPSSIGKAVSSGCIRMFDQDIIDLYNRVGEGTKVTVLPATPSNSIY